MLFVGVPVAALMNIFFSVVLAALLDKVGPVKPYLAKSAGTSPAGRYGIMRSSASLESISARNPEGQMQLVAEAGRGAEFSKYGCEISGSVRVSERSKSQRLDQPQRVSVDAKSQRRRSG